MPTTVLANANRVFPWLKHLSPTQIEEFYADFFDALEQTLQHRDWSILERAIESWQATAEVLASPELTTSLVAPISDHDMEDWHDVESNVFNSPA